MSLKNGGELVTNEPEVRFANQTATFPQSQHAHKISSRIFACMNRFQGAFRERPFDFLGAPGFFPLAALFYFFKQKARIMFVIV